MAIGDGSQRHAQRGGSAASSSVDDAAGGGSGQSPPPTLTLRLWAEVGTGIDKSQTVVWQNAVDSLNQAFHFLLTSDEARRFVETYMMPMIKILLEQQPSKIGQMEKHSVEESLRIAVAIICEDLNLKAKAAAGPCKVLDVLSMIFNRKKPYYKGAKPSWNVNLTGLPEVRVQKITRFRTSGGFNALATYLAARVSTNDFPPLDILHLLLAATGEAIPNEANANPSKLRSMEDEAIRISQAVMDFMDHLSEEELKKQPHEILSQVRYDLQRIFDRLLSSRRKETYAFYDFWRGLILKLITSQSLPLKLFGWEQLGELVEASGDMRPPPRAFIVRGAGCKFVNGRYDFAGPMTDDGYSKAGTEIRYELDIPDNVSEVDGGGKKLTLFRCTMRSQQKWWFISEADEDQPGTDKDIDYYQHKSKQHEENEPPSYGWVTCKNSGVDPAPTLAPSGLMVPNGEEYNTLEHQLAQWAVKNKIVDLVLGDSVHREIVARSTYLIKFLAGMCTRDDPMDIDEVGVSERVGRNAYCLRTSDLLLAWKTCTSRADAAVSAEIYQLLVSILPELPKTLAIPLLEAVQSSLTETSDGRNYLAEVAEFCGALALTQGELDSGGGVRYMTDEAREQVLKLLWAVVTHSDAGSLKSYEGLKGYLTHELRAEPVGTAQREHFLEVCKVELHGFAKNTNGPVDEVLVLRMVKLTKFILEACPTEQAIGVVTEGGLAELLFQEVTAFLRRQEGAKATKAPTGDDDTKALTDRLLFLRYAYGLSDRIDMTTEQLNQLWSLCREPSDREALMVFLANASHSDVVAVATDDTSLLSDHQGPSPFDKQHLAAAFSEEARVYTFQRLICSTDLEWEPLEEGAYQSFQSIFKSLRRSAIGSSTSRNPALDTLWRICLSVRNDNVAAQAMNDTLALYSSMASVRSDGNEKSGETARSQVSESFPRRIFDCLDIVIRDLRAKKNGAELSAARCLRILNSAVNHGVPTGKESQVQVMAGSKLDLPPDASLSDVMHALPHGMRGQSCYLNVAILVRRPSQTNATTVASPALREDGSNLPTTGATNGSQNGTVRQPTSVRFNLQLHPLETLASIKRKVAAYCAHQPDLVKFLSVSGRQSLFPGRGESYSVAPNDSTVARLGIADGSELVFLLMAHLQPQNAPISAGRVSANQGAVARLAEAFSRDGEFGSSDRFFEMLLVILESLPEGAKTPKVSPSDHEEIDIQKLVWDLLLSMPTNNRVVDRVRATCKLDNVGVDQMNVDSQSVEREWMLLLDARTFHRSVYTLQLIDSFMQPAPETLSMLPDGRSAILEKEMILDSTSFRTGFVYSGGFTAVLHFLSETRKLSQGKRQKTRMAYAVCLRIIRCCFFGSDNTGRGEAEAGSSRVVLDKIGNSLLAGLKDRKSLLESLTSVVVDDTNVSDSAILDALHLLRLLLTSDEATSEVFVSLSNSKAERFLNSLLLWERAGTVSVASVGASQRIRRLTEELILAIPSVSRSALPWLTAALDKIDVSSDGTSEFFSVVQTLVEQRRNAGDEGARGRVSLALLKGLGTAVCSRLATHPRPTSDNVMIDFSTGVLCGCLKLLRALVENGGGSVVATGVTALIKAIGGARWSQLHNSRNKGMFDMISSSFRSMGGGVNADDMVLIDLIGAVFDGFLSAGGSPSAVPICFEKESRQLGFEVIAAAARCCKGGGGYLAIVARVNEIISITAPSTRHRWGHNFSVDDRASNRMMTNSSKYSGLRNQGCTCYMNSVLQQLFMMPDLKESICAATVPSSLRSSLGGSLTKGIELVGKRLSLQWESGDSFDAVVEAYNEDTGMHTIRYLPHQIPAATGSAGGNNTAPAPAASAQQPLLPDELSDEFLLTDGRPGRETGVFEVVASEGGSKRDSASGSGESTQEGGNVPKAQSPETVDEASSRRLLEEVQRTFVNLDESSRGRCFDPRALVEASGCLKLEFDVWQQNDASEFAVKLLDRLELSLKRWSNPQFRFLEHTFRLKQTKQKICKECGLKTNREENLLNIDCQIRGKSDIHEALSTMCEVEYMEGDNKVNCERCRKKTDTVLRTAISALPDVLILSLKRFDLDYNTFETVKLNSRCAFGETLNMKKYTLEGIDDMEKGKVDGGTEEDSNMDTEDEETTEKVAETTSTLADEDYEYRLVGVLVHAGVAQGGHYYSFIKDRSSEKWYRFDDEDVSPFDPSSIEVECFGGKVKKETKWPNGHVHTMESEQFANALMVFYEKVKPSPFDPEEGDDKDVPMEEDDVKTKVALQTTTGFDVFQADVRRANANHRWQTFLSEVEFMSFLKELLGRANVGEAGDEDAMEVSSPASSSSVSDETSPTWNTAILRLSLSYFFDVLLHSSDKDAIIEWGKQLESNMRSNSEAAKAFVTDLARRTNAVSSNWLRVYCSECPEEVSRLAAIKVFAAAMGRCVGRPEEQSSLIEWTQAWRRQVEEFEEKRAEDRQSVRFVPSKLEGDLAVFEDASKLPGGRTSSIGVLLSTLALLLDHAPRTWRTSAHIPVLLGELGVLKKEDGGNHLRNAMVASQFPARLVCLGVREKSPQLLRSLFPYASMSVEDAESTVRPESTPTNHLMALPGAAVGMPGTNVGPSTGSPLHASSEDCANLVEALGAIIGVGGIKRAPLTDEIDDFTRTRAPKLTKVAEDALKIIFTENMSSTGIGMSHQNIQQYLRLCGIDSSSVPPGKITGILNQYPTKTGSEGGKECRFLTLEGFLMYYAEQAQNEERQVYGDLRRFGFRPNLTRRPEEARLFVSENQEERPRAYTITESVAIDVALSSKKQETIWLGRYAETGFLSHHFHFMAFGASVEASEYLLAAFACGRETGRLMLDAQRAFNRAAGWGGKDIAQSCLMVFKVLAAVPDERQPDRIAALMQGTEKNSDAPLGLINAAKEVSRTPQHYSSDLYNNPGLFERYIDAVKELRRQVKVYFWLSERRSKWTWMEHWLREVGVQQGRGDYMGQMEGVAVHPPGGPFGHQPHSDSDMNPDMNESDEEDEDSRFDQIDNHHAINRVHVKGAGNNPVNGVYVRSGSCDGVPKYTKTGILKETKETFSLFRCRLSNDTRRWYISIVPKNIAPGTNMDRDFYSAPPGTNPNYPPASRWTTAKDEGRDPPPTVGWRLDDSGEYDDVMDRGRGVGVEGVDAIDDGGNNYL